MRHRIARPRFAVLAVIACALAGASAATATAAETAAQASGAQASHGGVSAPGEPVVRRLVCKTGCPVSRKSRHRRRSRVKARPGSVIKLKGEFLDYVEHVVFRGPSGPMPVPLTYRSAILVRAIVPPGAISSRPYVMDNRGRRSNRAPRKLVIRAVAPAGPGVFPVQGPHTYGDGFGAARSGHTHQGQDVFAACGTPLVSAMTGTVQYAGYQSAAGNYIVIDNNNSSTDFVYMHMAYPATVRTVDAPVAAGQHIGVVGESGNAEGCHLHFEYWQGDWYGGGEPIDPLPYLKAWDATS